MTKEEFIRLAVPEGMRGVGCREGCTFVQHLVVYGGIGQWERGRGLGGLSKSPGGLVVDRLS